VLGMANSGTPNERDINFFSDGNSYTWGAATCVTRRSDSVPISNYGLQVGPHLRPLLQLHLHA